MRGVFSEAIAENMHLPLCNLIKGTDLDPLDERTGQHIVRDVPVCRKGIMIRYGYHLHPAFFSKAENLCHRQ